MGREDRARGKSRLPRAGEGRAPSPVSWTRTAPTPWGRETREKEQPNLAPRSGETPASVSVSTTCPSTAIGQINNDSTEGALGTPCTRTPPLPVTGAMGGGRHSSNQAAEGGSAPKVLGSKEGLT